MIRYFNEVRECEAKEDVTLDSTRCASYSSRPDCALAFAANVDHIKARPVESQTWQISFVNGNISLEKFCTFI